MSSDLDRLIRDLQAQGFTVTRTGKNRRKVVYPGRGSVIVPRTAKDTRSLKNCVSALVKIGYEKGGRR